MKTQLWFTTGITYSDEHFNEGKKNIICQEQRNESTSDPAEGIAKPK